MTDEIKLGDKVRDKITGFTGIAVNRTEFLNGCIQIGVQGKIDKEGKMGDAMGIDIQSLELVNKPKIKQEKRRTGGRNHVIPIKSVSKARGY